jgi:hypothetical protein
VSTALFGSSEVFGSTVGKTQGKTGQRGSAANFFPGTAAGVLRGHQFEKEAEAHGVPTSDGAVWLVRGVCFRRWQNPGENRTARKRCRFLPGTAAGVPRGHQFEKEAEAHGVPTRGRQIYKEAGTHDVRGSDGESDEDSAPFEWLVEADRKAMLALADNRSFRGASASRMAADRRAAEAAPGWTGVGEDYAAWLRDLQENPTTPGSVITDRAPERAYLVVMNGGDHLSVIHHLFRWKAPEGGRSRLDGRLVAFEGEVLDGHGLPRLWSFAEDEERLFQLRPLSVEALEYAAKFYRDGDRDDEFHDRQTGPMGVHGATVQTCQRLIPIPVGWAHQFLDNPSMGVAYRRMLQLMSVVADMADRRLFRAFGNGVALACGSPDPMAPNPVSAADSLWKRVAYSKATLSVATAAWEGHRPGASKPPPPSRPPTRFDLMFGGPAREEEGDQPWGDSWGYCRPNTPPPDPGALRTEGPAPVVQAPAAASMSTAVPSPPSSKPRQMPSKLRPTSPTPTSSRSIQRRRRHWRQKAETRTPN